MITSFKDTDFFTKNLCKYISVFLGYVIFIVLFFNCYFWDLFPQINVRALIQPFLTLPFTFAYLGVSITLFFEIIINEFLNSMTNIYDINCDIKVFVNFSDKLKFNFNLLDFSNPFLHSSKTRSLRE